MNKTKYLIASGTLVVSLLAATPALAFGVNGDAGVGIGIHLASIARFFDDDKVNVGGKFDNDNDNDTVGSTSISGGTVSSVNGNTFVVSPVKSGKATTTVVTNSSTVFKVNGSATTSAALTSGARVVVIGTTTATSTSGNTVEASLVLIFSKVVGFCKHWMHV